MGFVLCPTMGNDTTSPYFNVLFLTRYKPFPNRQWWVETMTGSMFVHVAIEHDGVVLNPLWNRGTEFWASRSFLFYPGLRCGVKVPARSSVDLDRYASSEHKPMWKYIARWATLGLVPFNDCVSTVRSVLDEAGVKTPRRIVTPGQLFRHLTNKGYKAYDATGTIPRA